MRIKIDELNMLLGEDGHIGSVRVWKIAPSLLRAKMLTTLEYAFAILLSNITLITLLGSGLIIATFIAHDMQIPSPTRTASFIGQLFGLHSVSRLVVFYRDANLELPNDHGKRCISVCIQGLSRLLLVIPEIHTQIFALLFYSEFSSRLVVLSFALALRRIRQTTSRL